MPALPLIPADLWFQLRAYLGQHPTCEVTLYFHQGSARKMRVAATVKAREAVSGTPPYMLLEAKEEVEQLG